MSDRCDCGTKGCRLCGWAYLSRQLEFWMTVVAVLIVVALAVRAWR